MTWCQGVFLPCEPIDGVQDCTCDGYSERLLSSVKAHSTSTSGKRYCESTSRYTRHKPNNVGSDLKDLRAHEHGELGDPWSELRFVTAGRNVACLSSCVARTVLYCLQSPCVFLSFCTVLVFSLMTRACVAQDTQHPILPAVVAWKRVVALLPHLDTESQDTRTSQYVAQPHQHSDIA